MDDLETVYKEDDVKTKDDSDEELEEDTDNEGNPRQHKTGPQGGKYYRVKIDGKWGPWNSETNESFKSIQNLLTESNIITIFFYANSSVSSKSMIVSALLFRFRNTSTVQLMRPFARYCQK